MPVDDGRLLLFVCQALETRHVLANGLPDQWELVYGLNPNDKSDAALDLDGDGLTNLEEYQAGANPLNPDSDGDGYNDSEEVIYGQDPTKKAQSPFSDVTAVRMP